MLKNTGKNMLAVGEVSLDVWSTIICYHLDLLSLPQLSLRANINVNPSFFHKNWKEGKKSLVVSSPSLLGVLTKKTEILVTALTSLTVSITLILPITSASLFRAANAFRITWSKQRGYFASDMSPK